MDVGDDKTTLCSCRRLEVVLALADMSNIVFNPAMFQTKKGTINLEYNAQDSLKNNLEEGHAWN